MSTSTMDMLFAAMKGSKSLPAVERIATDVLNSLNGDSKGHQYIADCIVEDAALTQKVLKLANSSMYTPFAKETSNVVSALHLLGSDALLHLVLGTPLISEEELNDDTNLSRTLLASELARNACTGRATDASIATLMCDLGRLLVGKFLPVQMLAVEQKIALGQDANDASRDVLGLTLQEVGIEVAKKWNLPPSILSTMDSTGDPLMVGIAQFSNTASALIQCGKSEEVQALVAELDLPGIDKHSLAGFVSQKLVEIKPISAIPLVVSAEAKLNDLVKLLASEEKQSVDELAAAVFAELNLHLQTAHCLLFMQTRTGEYRIRLGSGKGVDEIKSKLRLAKEFKPTAFHAVIKNNVDVSIGDVSRLKPTSLPDGFRDLLPNVTKFVILPIANGGVSGLLYCDWDSDRVISPAEMDALRKLRNLFVPFFLRT